MRFLRLCRTVLLLLGVLTCWVGDPVQAGAAPPAKPILVLREGLNGAINEWSGPAKFALYSDGTLITETSNELSETFGGPMNYLRTHLTPDELKRLLRTLDAERTLGTGKKQYGQGSMTWQVHYWNGSKRGRLTVQGQLDLAPARVAKLIRTLDSYPKRGAAYLGYNYAVRFENPAGGAQDSLPWPKTWHSIKFAQPMLTGVRAPDRGYEYKLDASHALQLKAMLTKANTNRIAVNGHVWNVKFYPEPHLPNDHLWMQKP